jgi:hypothetical protein
MKKSSHDHSGPGGMSGAAASAFGIGRPYGGVEPTEDGPSMR